MQNSVLKERHPNLQTIPSLGLKANKKPNASQAKDIVLTQLETAEGVASSPLPHPHQEAINVGYSTDSEGKTTTGVTTMLTDSTAHTTPKTPLKAARQDTPPLTPLANLKVLIAAASTAREKESEQQGKETGQQPEEAMVLDTRGEEHKAAVKEVEDAGGRKMKSLAILCKKFLSIADSEVGVGTDFSLESMCKKLGTNRRRIYDIINVLEALEMIVKQSKNWYTWLGQENLLVTLAKMRAMAEDDLDFRNHLYKENTADGNKENQLPPPPSPSVPPAVRELAGLETACKLEETASFCGGTEEGCLVPGGPGGGGRWDKSLGVLCQKFIMLFLVTPDNEVTLDFAGNILMPDDGSFSIQPTNPKTKVRRLYDIANVLTTLGLIRKKTFLAPNHRKMPGYSWAGPSLSQIQAISVFRKSEFSLYPFYSKKKGNGGGVPLTRKPSFGNPRPFLHQYEVKGQARAISCGPNSAPSSPGPMKNKGSGFKRSLSFGANSRKLPPKTTPLPPPQIAIPPQRAAEVAPEGVAMCATPISQVPAKPSKCVVARQLSPVQLDYLQEVKAFEAEIQKHTHKYPHVAPVFSEFVNKFLSTLEQATIRYEATPTATPTGLCSPPFNISPSKLAGSFFIPSISPVGVSIPSTPSNAVSPSGSGQTTPSLLVTAPPTTTQSCVENTTESHAHPVTAHRHIQNGGVADTINPVPCVETSGPFNPNSLLVNTANGGYSLFPSPPYLPLSCCYPLPTPPSTATMSGIKMGTVRSLAPKPVRAMPTNQEQLAGESAKESHERPSKRLRLDHTLN